MQQALVHDRHRILGFLEEQDRVVHLDLVRRADGLLHERQVAADQSADRPSGLELHPSEALATNVFGTLHVLDAAIDVGVDTFVNISTDKAADPINVLRRYEALAGATKEMVSTDVPQDLLPAFIELSLLVKDAQVTSLPFTSDVINTGNPDYTLIQRMVEEALEPPPPTPTSTATSAPTSRPTASASPQPDGPTPSPTPTVDEADGAVALDEVC